MFFVTRVFFAKATGQQSNSIQKYDDEVSAWKRFYSILASDIDSDNYSYELVQIVNEFGGVIASHYFDNRGVEANEE